MGMFDTINSSYKIFGEEHDGNLQTKDLACIMATYWISPAGELFEYSANDAYDLELIPKEERSGIAAFRHRANGNKGRVSVYAFTGDVRVCIKTLDGFYCKILRFKAGRIEAVIDTSDT